MQINGAARRRSRRGRSRAGALAVQITTNEVFDGTLDRALREDDRHEPDQPVWRVEAGRRAGGGRGRRPDHLIVRTAWILFGPGGRNFPATDPGRWPREALRPGSRCASWPTSWATPPGRPAWPARIASGGRRGAALGPAPGWEPATSRSRLGARELLAGVTELQVVPICQAELARSSHGRPPRAVLDMDRAPRRRLAPTEGNGARRAPDAALRCCRASRARTSIPSQRCRRWSSMEPESTATIEASWSRPSAARRWRLPGVPRRVHAGQPFPLPGGERCGACTSRSGSARPSWSCAACRHDPADVAVGHPPQLTDLRYATRRASSTMCCHRQLYVPVGFAHGFFVTRDVADVCYQG